MKLEGAMLCGMLSAVLESELFRLQLLPGEGEIAIYTRTIHMILVSMI